MLKFYSFVIFWIHNRGQISKNASLTILIFSPFSFKTTFIAFQTSKINKRKPSHPLSYKTNKPGKYIQEKLTVIGIEVLRSDASGRSSPHLLVLGVHAHIRAAQAPQRVRVDAGRTEGGADVGGAVRGVVAVIGGVEASFCYRPVWRKKLFSIDFALEKKIPN